MCTTNYHRKTEQGQFRTGESVPSQEGEEEEGGGNEKSGAGGLLSGVMRDIQTLSTVAETEVAFKDYRSLA